MKYTLINETGEEISIEWEKGDEVDNHGSGCVEYSLSGTGSDGKEYTARGTYQGDDLEEIDDIEEA